MGETTGISWTDHTHNPWEGCFKVSDGCKNCYAETRNVRFSGGKHWGPTATTPRLTRSLANWAQPRKWDRAAKVAGKRARVFCASLADVFEDHPDVIGERTKLFSLIEETPNLDWQLLTKRPENMIRLAPASWASKWPDNVWAGTTAESAEMLAKRAPFLRAVPARVRFLSCEPLLEALDDLIEHVAPTDWETPPFGGTPDDGIHWVIVGGESGPRARPFLLDWARRIVLDCAELDVACWVKQMGDQPRLGYDGEDAGEPGDEVRPIKFAAHHGADPTEWPEDLRLQQMPREALQSVGGGA